MKISFIATVYNEENSINEFIDSILKQTKRPDEIIIVDGGSTDNTLALLKNYKNIVVLQKKGNRSIGRNYAIQHASGDIIACSDAGCILDTQWLVEITKPFTDSDIDVVAGYYEGIALNPFQEALIPYVLVMPDKINVNSFLPATRSVAFTKTIWKKVGGFNEKLSNNEDYVFARKLKQAQATIYFQKTAIAYWKPRENIQQAFKMFYRFAYGDAESGILRTKVLFIFARYIIGTILIIDSLRFESSLYRFFILFLIGLYLLWPIFKNGKYVKSISALLYLPVLQIVSDLAVLKGTIFGYSHYLWDIRNKH